MHDTTSKIVTYARNGINWTTLPRRWAINSCLIFVGISSKSCFSTNNVYSNVQTTVRYVQAADAHWSGNTTGIATYLDVVPFEHICSCRMHGHARPEAVARHSWTEIRRRCNRSRRPHCHAQLNQQAALHFTDAEMRAYALSAHLRNFPKNLRSLVRSDETTVLIFATV